MNRKKKILMIFGTRPEAIKMAPLVSALKATDLFEVEVCLTAQHREMLDQVMAIFELEADYDLNVMTSNQTLEGLTESLMSGVSKILRQTNPDLVLVHGDTTTTFIASLAAFYQKIAVGHVEAGLRTGSLQAPWPEEANRRLTSVLTQYHFAPTQTAKNNLLKENILQEQIIVTGNTVIDALFAINERIQRSPDLTAQFEQQFSSILDPKKKLILVTGHRRENFGTAFERVLNALRAVSQQHPDIQIIFPVHLNPAVRKPVYDILDNCRNIHLIEPLDYLSFVYLLTQAYLVVTDSGGIQEEAPSLGIPVLVTREVTERPEAVDAGTVRLVGTDQQLLIHSINILLTDNAAYTQMSRAINPYGDGQACSRIVKFLTQALN